MRVVDKLLKEEFRSVSEEEYQQLLRDAASILDGENLVRREYDKFVVVGDTHGYLESTKVPVERAISEGIPIVFLGDYVDRGPQQLENLAYVLSIKLQRPSKTVLLRGNHETERMNHNYGFYSVANSRFSSETYQEILKLYQQLPVAALVNGEYFMVHGGIPEGIDYVDEISDLSRNDERYKEIFWNDPNEEGSGFSPNFTRGGYKLYGKEVFDDFMERNDLKMMFRSHQCFPSGYKYFFEKRLLNVFSVVNYCSNPEGTYALVSGDSVSVKKF